MDEDRHLLAARQLFMRQALSDIRDAFGRAGIDSLVLKGPSLAATVYDHPTDRPFADLDILVAPGCLEEAATVLKEQGYVFAGQRPDRRASVARANTFPMVGHRGVGVELHRSLSSHGLHDPDLTGLMARRIAFTWEGETFFGLEPTDLLLHLCIHMTKSLFMVEPKHVEDLARVANRLPVDWGAFVHRAQEANTRIGAFYALRAGIRAGASVPPAVMEKLAPDRIRRVWLDAHLADAHPLYRFPRQPYWQIQARIGLALMDNPRQWPAFAAYYIGLRIADGVMQVQEKMGRGRP